jgi:hypothetical protein
VSWPASSASRAIRQAGDLVKALDLARTDARALARKRATEYDPDGGLADDLALAVSVAGRLISALDGARRNGFFSAHEIDIARHLVHKVDEDFASARNLQHNFSRTRARLLSDDLAQHHASAQMLVNTLMHGRPVEPGRQRARRRKAFFMSPAAARLAATAAWLLPSPERERYREEFRSELWELAAAGASRRHQVGHAAQVLTQAWVMRTALRSPARRRAVP